jgi:hypothetical protein
MASWHRITLSSDQSIGPFRRMGDRLRFAGRLHPGTSIWYSDDTIPLVAQALGTHPQRVRTLEHGVTEIYFSPGTKEMLEGDLLTGGYVAEPYDRPYKDDLGLLVGDQRDLTD